MKLKNFLFNLLLILLPTQLGRHFFPQFSFISGIRSDYLAPTVYLTDAIIIILIAVEFWGFVIKNLHRSLQDIIRDLSPSSYFWQFFSLIVFYLAFTSIFIAANPFAAVYKLVKIIEFSFLFLIIIRLKPNIFSTTLLLTIGVLSSGFLAIMQFINQSSLGGLFWYLGERTFTLSTPGIAKIALNGQMLLRPYATFSHPNVLGGFLAVMLNVVLAVILYYRQNISKRQYLFYLLSFIVGLFALVLTYSKASFAVFLAGLVLVYLVMGKKNNSAIFEKNSSLVLGIFISLILLSFFTPFVLPQSDGSFRERAVFISTSFEMFKYKPVFGYGLNNFIVHFKDFVARPDGIFIYQPIHNVYLLVLLETGLWGVLVFMILLFKLIRRSFKAEMLLTVAIWQLLVLGLFDHYLFTLQQAQLLFTIFASLVFLPRKS